MTEPTDDDFYLDYIEALIEERCGPLEPEPIKENLRSRPVALEFVLWMSSGLILMIGAHMFLNA